MRVKKFSDPNYNVYSDDQANIQYQDPSKQAQLLQKKSPWTQYTQVILTFFTLDSSLKADSSSIFAIESMYLTVEI